MTKKKNNSANGISGPVKSLLKRIGEDELNDIYTGLLKRHELARALSISPRSVDNFQKAKVIPVIRITPRCVRFDLRAVLRALERFTVREAK
jgi:hypothetical protein